jgi:ATP-dependent 26S proteasome regulatory subunit
LIQLFTQQFTQQFTGTIVYLLEDIDATIPAAENKSDDLGCRLSFRGLMNSLNAVTSAKERIIFIITNHREKLDPSLIRPGCIDFRQHINDFEYLSLYPENAHLAERFTDSVFF